MTQKQKMETGDKTNPFTGLGLFGSRYQRKFSQSRSTASNGSMNNSLQINPQNLMPLLLTIKEQNQQLSKDRDKIKQQMKILEGLSNNILSQNEALRLHYAQRSTDVQMLVKSLSLNINQNLTQNKHLVHTFRQNNGIIAKQIQQINSNIFHIQQMTKKMGQQLERITKQNTLQQNDLRNRMVKNKIIQNNIKKLQKIKEQNLLEQVQSQICDLQFEINKLKKKNILTINFIRSEKTSLQNQKPVIKQLALETIKSHQRLKFELEQLQMDYKKFCQRNQQLKLLQENQIKRCQSIYGQSQSKGLNLNQLTFKKKELESRYAQSKGRTETLKSQKAKIESKKLQIEKLVSNKKKDIQNLAKEHQKSIISIKTQTKNKTSQIKQKIRKIDSDLTKTIKKQLNPQKTQVQNTIIHLKQQLQGIQKQAKKIQNEVGQLNNPIRQLMRLQFQLKQAKSQKQHR